MMKKNFPFYLLILMFALFIASCNPDPNEPTTNTPPTITLLSGSGFVSGDANVNAGATFTAKVSTSAGNNNLKSLAVYEDGVLIPTTRLTLNGGSAGSGNPILVTNTETSGFIWEVGVQAHSTTGTKTYRFTVLDVASESQSVSVNINTTPQTVFDLTLKAGAGCVAADVANVVPNSLMKICPKGTRGTTPLQSIAVLENDVLISDLTRLRFGVLGTNFTGNPMTLPTEFKNELDTVVYVKIHASGTKKYTIRITDESGAVKEKSFNAGVAVIGTAITTISGSLYNAAGPVGTGGLDLDAGLGTGSSDSAAEIKDLGGAGTLWMKKISAANDAELRTTSADFNTVNFKEDLPTIFTNGTAVTTSSTIAVGSTFIVKRGSNYYLIRATAVNETSSDNDDNIAFSIKK